MRTKLGVDIHQTAVVSQSAELGADVVIGPTASLVMGFNWGIAPS